MTELFQGNFQRFSAKQFIEVWVENYKGSVKLTTASYHPCFIHDYMCFQIILAFQFRKFLMIKMFVYTEYNFRKEKLMF